MSVVEKTAEVVLPRTTERRHWSPKSVGDMWWRHVVGIAFSLIALFPVAYVLSAAFNADSSLSNASLIPRHVTLDNFGKLLKPANSLQNTSTGALYGNGRAALCPDNNKSHNAATEGPAPHTLPEVWPG